MSRYLKFIFLAAIFTILLSFNIAALTVIDNMDDVTQWTGTSLVQETKIIKEGKGAVRIDSPTQLMFERKFTTPIDLSQYKDNGVISFWIYFENVDVFPERDNSLEFTSSGGPDVNESAFTLDTFLFEKGWNHIVVGLDEFASYDADWSAINYIRFYKFTDSANTMIVDDIKIGTAADFGVGKVPVKDTATLFESFDSAEGFDSKTVESVKNIEGTGAIAATSDSLLSIAKTYAAPVDMSRMAENGYAYIWVYIEDPSLLAKGGSLEITSGGVSGTEATTWSFDGTTEFKAGWNELLLDVSKASDNKCDFSRVNYLHVSMPTSGANTMMLDKMYLGVGEDFGIKPVTEAPTTEVTTEAPATTASVTTAASSSTSGKSNNNAVLYGIIAVAAVAVVIVVIAVVANSKKKKK